MPPLILVAIAWLAGLVLAHHLLVPAGIQPAGIALLAAVPLAVLPLWRRDRSTVLVAVCTLAFLGGALRLQWHVRSLDDPEALAHHNDKGWVTLVGVVRAYPDVRDTWTGLVLEAEEIEVEGSKTPVHGRVLVRSDTRPAYHYGDRLRISGLLKMPPVLEDLAYRKFLAQKGIYSQVSYPLIEKTSSGQGSPALTLLYEIKERAADVITRLMPEPEASLLQGILLGIRSGIPRELYKDYNRTGASHIIVISGANIMIVAALFARAFGWLVGKRKAFWFTLVGIGLYVLLVGADPVVVRAGIMAGLLVTAGYLGRRAAAYVSLGTATMLMTLINPLTLWNVGFQLSVAAFLGLILFTKPMEQATTRLLARVVSQEQAEGIVRMLAGVPIVTLAALVLTVPLITYHFGRLSLVAPITNLFILSIQPHIMSWGAAATMAGMFPPLEPAARVLALVPWLLLAFTNAVVRWTASWPLASVQVSGLHPGWLAVLFGLPLGALLALRRPRHRTHQMWNQAPTRTQYMKLLGLLLMALVLYALALGQLPDGRLHVAFLDVGQGDAILITTPRGRQILVDGGPGSGAITSALGRVMPFWDHDIDLVVLTHTDIDHLGGLPEVLKRYEVGVWLDNGATSDSEGYLQCQRLWQEADVPHHVVHVGDRLDLGQNASLEVLHPDTTPMLGEEADSNNHSVVLRLVWNEASFLLTGDLEAEGERHLIRSNQGLSADVLKVSHHGSGGASTQEFLAAVAPTFAIISAGEGNKYNHPDPTVLERLNQLGDVRVLRTDEQGTVEFSTDGQRLWVHTQQ